MSFGKPYTLDSELIYTYGLEYYLADHCNLSCMGCSQSSPFAAQKLAQLSEFEYCLDKIKPYLRPDRISFLGGEPLLHPQIIDFIDSARSSAIFNKIVVTTNGLLLGKASPKLWEKVDLIEISVYPNTKQSIKKNLTQFFELANTHNTELCFYSKNEFKHILFSSPMPDGIVTKVFDQCYFKNFCHTICDRKFYKCAPSASCHHYLSHFTGINNTEKLDFIELGTEQDEFFRKNLLDFLDNYMPLSACRFCAGSSGTSFPNEQLRKRDIPVNEFSMDKITINAHR